MFPSMIFANTSSVTTRRTSTPKKDILRTGWLKVKSYQYSLYNTIPSLHFAVISIFVPYLRGKKSKAIPATGREGP
jgi:hypothetical protein